MAHCRVWSCTRTEMVDESPISCGEKKIKRLQSLMFWKLKLRFLAIHRKHPCRCAQYVVLSNTTVKFKWELSSYIKLRVCWSEGDKSFSCLCESDCMFVIRLWCCLYVIFILVQNLWTLHHRKGPNSSKKTTQLPIKNCNPAIESCTLKLVEFSPKETILFNSDISVFLFAYTEPVQ